VAVDIIPGKDDTLGLIEFVRDETEQTLAEIDRNTEKIRMISILEQANISIGPLCTRMIDIKAEYDESTRILLSRAAMWAKYLSALPQICPRCNGKRYVDSSGSGWMAERCRGCDARGYIPRT